MGRPAGWMKELTGRAPMKSPGAPSLASGRRAVVLARDREGSEQRGGRARGRSVAAGWHALVPRGRWDGADQYGCKLSGRFLSFGEREELALLNAQRLAIREIARRIRSDRHRRFRASYVATLRPAAV